jgi:hypothetical protein
MTLSRLIRCGRSHCRTLVVWAMMPLVTLNGRTVIGCGCTGRFEAECRCSCSDIQKGGNHTTGEAGCRCCAHNRSRPSESCCKHIERDSGESKSTIGKGLQSRTCTTMAMHVADPATISSLNLHDGIRSAALHLTAFEIPFVLPHETIWGRSTRIETGPPPDNLLVTLGRLLI